MRIRELRKKLHMTQEELAQKLGYDRSSISKIEKGLVDLSIDKVKDFAKVLHCTPSYLMGWANSPTEYQKNIFDIIDKDAADQLREAQFDRRFELERDYTITKLSKEELLILECYRKTNISEKEVIKRILEYDKALNELNEQGNRKE